MYKNIKTNFKTENYLENLKDLQKCIIAQSRCVILPIRIETGPYKGGPLDERIWNFCVLNEIEDKYTILLNCTKYCNFKTELFNNIGHNPTSIMSILECSILLLSNFNFYLYMISDHAENDVKKTPYISLFYGTCLTWFLFISLLFFRNDNLQTK